MNMKRGQIIDGVVFLKISNIFTMIGYFSMKRCHLTEHSNNHNYYRGREVRLYIVARLMKGTCGTNSSRNTQCVYSIPKTDWLQVRASEKLDESRDDKEVSSVKVNRVGASQLSHRCISDIAPFILECISHGCRLINL